MMDDGSWFRTVMEWAGGGLLTAMGWLVRGHNARLRKMEDTIFLNRQKQETDHSFLKSEISSFALRAEERFAKEHVVQNSLNQINGRLDDIFDILVKKHNQ